MILFIFRERGREGEREGEKHQSMCGCSSPETQPATQARALTGNRTSDPLVRRPALNQSTEPHYPGLILLSFLINNQIISKLLYVSSL